MTRTRTGFTLWEMAIVLAVMAVGAILVAPAIARLGTEQVAQPAAGLITLLTAARKTAIEGNATLTLRLDPVSGHYRADTTGVGGTGEVGEGTLVLDGTETLSTPLPRLVWVFRPTGAAFADTVLVRGAEKTVLVAVDPWSGVARADAR